MTVDQPSTAAPTVPRDEAVARLTDLHAAQGDSSLRWPLNTVRQSWG